MPHYRYTGDAPARVKDDDGVLRRIAPGAVVSTDEGSTFDKNLSARNGFESCSDKDAAKARSDRAGNGDGVSRDVPRDKAYSDARVYARHMNVSAPLNEVVGDDEAPHGPPTGTITTKQAAAREHFKKHGRQQVDPFGDNEWLPGEDDDRRLSSVQAKQLEDSRVVENVTERLQNNEYPINLDEMKGAAGDSGPGIKDEPKQSGPPAEKPKK